MYTPTLAPPLPAPTSGAHNSPPLRMCHHSKLAPWYRPAHLGTISSPSHHPATRASGVKAGTLALRMSESGGMSRKGSFGRRLSKKLSSWRVDAKGEDVVESVEEEDVSEPSESTIGASKPEHLVILVNGIWGSVKNWEFATTVLKEKLGEKVVIHRSASNGGWKTHAGVDIMGDRLAKEVMKVIEMNPGVRKISFVGHSLGGLISRYAIGQLYAPPGGRSLLQERAGASTSGSEAGVSGRDYIGAPLQATIAGLEPVNFITLATPHLGCRGNSHLPFLFGRAALEWAAPFVSPLIIGPTGRHLFLNDGNKDRRPLLERMVTDCDEGKFLSALRCFKRRVAYANVCHDRMVGWRTASIRKASEMPEPLQEPDASQKHLSKYVYIVREEEVPLADKEPSRTGGSEPKDAPALDVIEEVMVAGLQQVSWHRVDVNFSKTDRLHEAHNLIQVKNEAWHSEGKHVIYHIIDNYF